MTDSETNILAIVVTYYPERKTLLELVEALSSQVNSVIVVDNTPTQNDIVWEILDGFTTNSSELKIIRFGTNMGIAAALNAGIQVAFNEGFSHVLLSDQDSLPTRGMVSGLLSAEAANSSPIKKVGAVGPVYQDKVTNLTYPFQVHKKGALFYSHQHASSSLEDIECLTLITSGTLIKTNVLHKVGMMREDLFIDQVDIEWSHRATSMGYLLIGTGRSLLIHNMGDECLRIWYFGWRNFNGYNPLRLYYRFRNYILLLKAPYINLRWKIRSAVYFAVIFYAQIIFSSDRYLSFKAILSGIFDGFCGKTGSIGNPSEK